MLQNVKKFRVKILNIVSYFLVLIFCPMLGSVAGKTLKQNYSFQNTHA